MEESDKIRDGATLLMKCPKNRTSTVIHRIIDGLCGKAPSCYDDFADVWTLDDWWQVTDFYRTFCRDVVKEAHTKCRDVKEAHTKANLLERLSFLQTEYREKLADAIWVRRDEIRAQLVKETAQISHAYLKDFDWQLKLVVSSDKLASVQEPLLAVDLDIDGAGEEEGKSVSVEMNKDDLQKMIASLEAANKVVMEMTT